MKRVLIIMLLAAGFSSCERAIWNAPMDKGEKPLPISKYSVKNLNGRSVIHYEINDGNTLYVLAQYRMGNGELREVKASKYVDSLVLNGFSKLGNYGVELIAVGSDEQRSEPVKLNVSPLTAPYELVLPSIKASASFSGIFISGTNEHEDNLVVETLTKDETGKWEVFHRYYTRSNEIKYNVRGLANETKTFGFCIRDRWFNYSDTVFATLTPLLEYPISMANYQPVQLSTDAPEFSSASAVRIMFDGNLTVNRGYTSARNTGMPQHFTINLMGSYQISRLHIYQRPGGYFFAGITPKRFRIWGSQNPNTNGELDDSWVLMGEFEVFKPSGLPLGLLSAEDTDAAVNGESYEFFDASVPFRYLRFQTLETFGDATYVTIKQMEIYGSAH